MVRLAASALTAAEQGVLGLLRAVAPVQIWATGGWVRDRLLEQGAMNQTAHHLWERVRGLAGAARGDLDVLVGDMTAQALYQRCRRPEVRAALRGEPMLVPARGARTLDTVKLRLPEHNVDITSLLDKVGAAEGIEPLRTDAEHRDVTFNACYYDPACEEVFDPTAMGISDLQNGVVRSPHPDGAMASIQEDPVRLLRAFRFAARFDFELSDDLIDALEEAPMGELLQSTPPGRILHETKRALLLHNRPSSFLRLLGGAGRVNEHLFGSAGEGPLRGWAAGVGSVRRLEGLVLEGLDRGILSSRSVQWRGRRPDTHPPALMSPDWRRTGVYENDWAELVLAALLWRCSDKELKRVGVELQLSTAMIDNISALQAGARQKIITPQTAPPGVHLLNFAVATQDGPSVFWERWPCLGSSQRQEQQPKQTWGRR